MPWDGHRVMRVDGIGVEMVRECPEKELVDDTARVRMGMLL